MNEEPNNEYWYYCDTHEKKKHYTNSYKNVIYINRELSDQITDIPKSYMNEEFNKLFKTMIYR